MSSNRNPKRFSGILVHPTSFPGRYGIGDLGGSARDFIDYLVRCGQKLWQVLPLGHTGYGDSPYQSFSAFAGQPLLISPDELLVDGLLSASDLTCYPQLPEDHVDYGAVIRAKDSLLLTAFSHFCQLLDSEKTINKFENFCHDNKYWLDDYSLFMALKEHNNGKCWLEWPSEERLPTPQKRLELTEQLKHSVKYYQFVQFVFFKQWFALKEYADSRGIQIVGDIPIFVSLDSADVWANRTLFQLDETGYPTVVAGVPPDYFSETGQLWGNPLYNWKTHEKAGYDWWITRIRFQLQLVDYIRIDHFRGLDSYWAIPYGEKTAVNGCWCKGPGAKFFTAIRAALGTKLPIWAEDLGIVTEDVQKLRERFRLPGMKILQFAFEDTKDNEMLPEHYTENCICYTGTHDNDTSLGWYQNAATDKQKCARTYMHTGAALISWAFIRTALESRAKYAVIPLQDILSLDSSARMNTPGCPFGNWSWRFKSNDLDEAWGNYLNVLTQNSNR